ncbi:hypothetical protein [Paractinoplanes globisporus]|jgi:hypothetical protein|uniref:Uncharacterized protein n=1 Tax=Paractinoplanes globisporus TaxID=113565 RepID=A0ABW6WRZ9_9ACTN|nr:hypothetical protein [Actinoplanes globisporus]
MFATIKNLIPEPRQAAHPRHYVGRHRRAEPVEPVSPAAAPVSPAPVVNQPAPIVNKPAGDKETAAA